MKIRVVRRIGRKRRSAGCKNEDGEFMQPKRK
jgi:hypothetical protein